MVADVPYRSATDAQHPVLYLPVAQSPSRRFVVHARVANEGEAIAALERAIRTADARIVVGAAMPLSALLDRARTPGRVAQWIAAAAGILQLGLALMALWGLVAYAVERRTAEIAIRRALGATEAGIVQRIMGPSVWLLAAGAAFGCVGGVLVTQVVHAKVTGLPPLDLRMVVPAALLLGAVVLTAAWLAARRAGSIEPASALKQA